MMPPAAPVLKIEYRPIESLVAYDRNPRTHSDTQVAQIAASIRAFGWTNPVLVDGQNGIIAGHGRVLAAILLEMTEVPAIELAGLTEEQKRAYVIADNQLALNAGWDEDLLALELGALRDLQFDTDLLGFSERDFQQLLNRLEQQGGNGDPDGIPDPPEEPVTRPGDVWLLGEHRVLCGDSTDHHDVKIVMNGEEAACLWTDPPYGVSYVGGTERKLTIKNDDRDGLEGLLGGAFAAIDPLLVSGAAIYIAHPAGPNALVFVERFVAQGWTLRQGLVWKKDRIVVGHSDYHYGHEPILYGLKPGYAGRRGRGAAGWYGGNACSSVFEIPSPVRNEDHPTAKPVALVAAMITNSSRTGEVVFDGFLGSGSTLIACEQTGRRCFGVELDPRYVDVVVKRWEQFTGKTAELVAGAATEHGK